MKVRFTEFCAGPTGGYPAGTVADVPDNLAELFIERGRAVRVKPGRPPRERAQAEPSETR